MDNYEKICEPGVNKDAFYGCNKLIPYHIIHKGRRAQIEYLSLGEGEKLEDVEKEKKKEEEKRGKKRGKKRKKRERVLKQLDKDDGFWGIGCGDYAYSDGK